MLTSHFKSILAGLIILFCAGVGPAAAQNPDIPFAGYEDVLPGDPAPITEPPFIYRAVVTDIYDSDTLALWIDKGFNDWRHDERSRLAGVNAYEITRKYKTTKAQVKIGYQCRDLMIGWLGNDPKDYPHKAKYHRLKTPSDVIIQSIGDKSGKFGRPLVIIWKDGRNLNQLLARSGCAVVTWYDKKTYPRTAVIVPR